MALSALPFAWSLCLSDCLVRIVSQMPSLIALALTAMINESSAASPACGSTRECPSSANHGTAEVTV
eukprot:6953294-Pyramimonas_sp.AAC.1